ncbi:MAG TPA: glycosyltransferase [Verrucomicrobiae bacterium]|nr:glycosyltransferase [Verrucomicrobiae bacterium]
MARILFVHNNHPGRFGFLLPALKAQGHECAAIARGGRQVEGIPLLLWKNERPNTPGILDLALRAETDFLRGRATADCAIRLKQGGFEPDVIIGHPGWGETLFMKEIFPKASQILEGEFYYRSRGGDIGFDPEFGQQTMADNFRVHAKNAAMAMAYAEADRIVCPTPFQASVFPAAFRDRAVIIHEGIDTDRIKPVPGAMLRVAGERILDGSAPIITFVNRTFEPMRGFHVMMRALPALLEAVPDVHVLMIGSDKPRGYGVRAPKGSTWRQALQQELGDRLDRSRVLFTGLVPHDTMLSALSLSSAHVYYTYPFVLSWSLLEAMACKCLILGSDTPPLRDAIEHGGNGLLNGFFDVSALSQAMIDACREPKRFASMRQAARETAISRFDRQRVCLPAWLKVIQELLPS